MKLKLMNDEGTAIALVESAGPKHGVVVSGAGAQIASNAVNACRIALKEKLGRVPTPDEIVAELAATDKRFEAE